MKTSLNVLYSKFEKIILTMFQNKTQSMKNKLFFQYSKRRMVALSCNKNVICIITSKHDADFYYLNYLHSFRTKNKLESHKKVCEDKDFCTFEIPSEDTKK